MYTRYMFSFVFGWFFVSHEVLGVFILLDTVSEPLFIRNKVYCIEISRMDLLLLFEQLERIQDPNMIIILMRFSCLFLQPGMVTTDLLMSGATTKQV